MVYDFDGDGKSEVILKTAPGSKDGEGNYVSKAGKNIPRVTIKKIAEIHSVCLWARMADRSI